MKSVFFLMVFIIVILLVLTLIVLIKKKRIYKQIDMFKNNNKIHLKKNIPDINHIAEIPLSVIDGINSIIKKEYNYAWEHINEGRSKKFSVHKDTESLSIISLDLKDHLDKEIIYEDLYYKLKPYITQIETILKKKYNCIDGYIGRALLAKLFANKKIRFHKDNGFSLSTGARCHIPLITNKDVIFTCGNTSKNLKVGNIYEINNSITHGVSNNSNFDRTHLILDFYDDHNQRDILNYWYNRKSNLIFCSGLTQERLFQGKLPIHLFIISSSNSGSSLMSKYISFCDNVSGLKTEGQFVKGFVGPNPRDNNNTKHLYLETKDIYTNEKNYDFDAIKNSWYNIWNYNKPILLEKSPTSILRLSMLKKHFPNCRFLFLVRNPYALIDGIVRGNKIYDYERAGNQAFNVLKLIMEEYEKYKDLSILIKYEDLTDNTELTKKKLIQFLPDLHDLNFNTTHRIKSYYEPINNMNQRQIDNLPNDGIRKANKYLNMKVMEYFNYKVIYPKN